MVDFQLVSERPQKEVHQPFPVPKICLWKIQLAQLMANLLL
jgi:hypothetical protein